MSTTFKERWTPAGRLRSLDTGDRSAYDGRLNDLSEGSVRVAFDPYLDIDWDSPDFEITDNDVRWILPENDLIGGHPWYKALPLETKIRAGMWRQANFAKAGSQFESILIRGLMQFSMAQPNGSAEFRYSTHEAKEECNHTLMFQELVNRVGLNTPGMPKFYRAAGPLIPLIATVFPCLFFMAILAGEEPIDHVQKDVLRSGKNGDRHPAMDRVIQIHIAEEARHIGFAHTFLRHYIPGRSRFHKLVLGMMFPVLLKIAGSAILKPTSPFWEEFDVPKSVKKDIFWRNPESKRIHREVYGDLRMLASEIGLMHPAAKLSWKLFGIYGRAARYRSEPQYAAI